jgi:2,5-diamino-6-(ribosylamino)-4(3H)-pyrimidinone 5'-phosphate reductase
MKAKRSPYVILNAAMTADGKIDTVTRQGAKISSDADWARVDQLRAEVDAVMVGGHTLLAEDPRLVVKSEALRQARVQAGRPENPAKIGLLSYLDLPEDSRFLHDGGGQVYLFTTRYANFEKADRLRALGADVVVSGEDRVDLEAAMAYLKDVGIQRILLEGGATLNAAMLAARWVAEIRIYIAPLVFGGAAAPTLVDGAGFLRDAAIELERQSVELLPDGGVLMNYLVR